MNDYQSAVKSAQQAVEFIQDEKLKEIAFTQILQHLLTTKNIKAPEARRSDGSAAAKSPGQDRSAAAWLFI